MSELNREQVIKAMECCYDNNLSCIDCPFQASDKYVECAGLTLSALSLIKELTEENERLYYICQSYALQYGTATDKEVFLKKERADTVRKMQERLKAKVNADIDRCYALGFSAAGPLSLFLDEIDQIAKEMIEDDKMCF